MAARSARIQPRQRGVQSAMIPLRPLLATLLASAALHAGAHDTWFEPLPAGENEVLLALGTGTQYPKLDTSLDARYLVQQGCSTAGEAAATRMRPVRNTNTALVLRAPRDAASCWAQLMPFEVEIPAATVEVYFKDIQASAEVRAAWAAMRQRGLPWRERYTKHARIELGSAPSAPSPMDFDLRLEAGGQPLQVGATLVAQLLRDGRPLAGQALQLLSENSPLGIWRTTDEQGRIRVTVPLAGHWVLRGVDLHVSATDPDRWESRFVTLAFAVLPKS